MKRLKNKIIVITGGSGLLGRSFIKMLIENGAIVYNFDIHDPEESIYYTFIRCDITNEVSVEEAINMILTKHGQIDGWINNAYPRTNDWGNDFEDITFESWKLNVNMQLNSLFLCCQKVLKIMKNQNFGSLINIASIYGIVGPDFSIYENTNMTMPAAYSAIKGGAINFTKYLASYYGKYSIRINSISPGGIFNNQNIQFVNKYEKKVPLQRMGRPEDISPSIIYLLSDESRYVTGHNLVIDGGWTCI